MTWPVIARQDWPLTVETRSAKFLLGLLVSALLLLAYLYPVLGADPITTARFPEFVSGMITTLVPFVGVLLSYDAVASERESGSVLLRLSLPHSRRDVVAGKWASRAGVLTTTLVGTLLVAGALVVYPFGELVLLRFLGFVLLTVAFGVLWCNVGLAVSLVASTQRRALVLGFTVVFLFVLAWDAGATAVDAGLRAAGLVEGELPGLARFALGVHPGGLFERLVTGFVVPDASVDGPWYLGPWVALVLFALWTVGPLGVATAYFEGRDLS